MKIVGDAEGLLEEVLESAAKLQEIVPDAVLVGGTAAAFHAGHRASTDHDHVLADLQLRFDLVLEALEATDGWITNRLVANKIILGRLGDIEAGVRQLIRRKPLETADIMLSSGRTLRVPTLAETLRIKGYLLISRNQTRDYLEVVALADHMGIPNAATVLSEIDDYYGDQRSGGKGVASQLARQLAEPKPADERTTHELRHYKRLDPKWHDWHEVAATSKALAEAMLTSGLSGPPTETKMSDLEFRNLDLEPTAPVEEWPTEGVIAALERGQLPDWRRLAEAVRGDPWGPVARRLEDALKVTRPYGVAPLLEGALSTAREAAAAAERDEVARRVRHYLRASRLDRRAFAEAIGTSTSRLSTYLNGKVAPSSTLLVRMERVAEKGLDLSRNQACSLPDDSEVPDHGIPRPPILFEGGQIQADCMILDPADRI